MDNYVYVRVDSEIKKRFFKLKKISGKGFPTMSLICRSALLEFLNSLEEQQM